MSMRRIESDPVSWPEFGPGRLLEEFVSVGGELAAHSDAVEALPAVTATALRLIPSAEHAGISRVTKRHSETTAQTSDVPPVVDAIQYALGRGPCLDAIREDTVFRVGDLRVDPRWPEFGRRAAAEAGILSMLSFRLFLDGEHDLRMGLNLYAGKPHAFSDADQTTGLLLATHCAQGVALAREREHSRNLAIALQTSRHIGMAIGILMARFAITAEESFDLLRMASQRRHIRLTEIAEDVVETGTLDVGRIRRR